MATVQMDYTEGTARQTPTGIEILRTAMVTDLTAAESGRTYEALTAAGIPDLGDPHPSVAESLALDIAVDLIDLDKAMVRITYRKPTPEEEARLDDVWLIEFSTAISTETIETDIQGTWLADFYAFGGRDKYYYWTTDVQRPAQIMRARKYGAAYATLIPYVGTVNNATWNGYAARTWLCTGISGTPGDWITLEFAQAPGGAETWDYTTPGWVSDPLYEPDGFLLRQGQETFQVYLDANFSALGITF